MKIRIIRNFLKGETLDGILSIDGEYVCDTSENVQTAIPAGTYPLVRHYCKHLDRFMPLIQNGITLPDCTQCKVCGDVFYDTCMPLVCPQLKIGNGIHHRFDGRIIVGTRIVPGCLEHSHLPHDIISERLRKCDSRGLNSTITIIDSF